MKNQTDTLNDSIAALQHKSDYQWKELKGQFELTAESLKPINIVKTLINQITTSPEIKGNILDSIIGLGAGLLANKVIIGSTVNPIKKLAGILLQYTVGNVISKHTGGIKSQVEILYKTITGKVNSPKGN